MRLTSSDAGLFLGSWSPDGSRIAFVGADDPLSEPKNPRVGVLDAATGERRWVDTLDRSHAPYPAGPAAALGRRDGARDGGGPRRRPDPQGAALGRGRRAGGRRRRAQRDRLRRPRVDRRLHRHRRPPRCPSCSRWSTARSASSPTSARRSWSASGYGPTTASPRPRRVGPRSTRGWSRRPTSTPRARTRPCSPSTAGPSRSTATASSTRCSSTPARATSWCSPTRVAPRGARPAGVGPSAVRSCGPTLAPAGARSTTRTSWP